MADIVSYGGVRAEDGTYLAGEASKELVAAVKKEPFVAAALVDNQWVPTDEYGAVRVTVESVKSQ